jgi:uncharacterized protein (DUF433 family)
MKKIDQKKAPAPNELDLQLLDLAAEVHVGGAGPSMGAILPIMRDRGFDDREVYDALEILEKQKCIRLKNYRGVQRPLDYADTVVSITTDGKDRLRHLAASVHMNFKLKRPLADGLAQYAGRRAMSPTQAATQFILEGLRREQFPGIDFRWTRVGRQPFVSGTGLTAWEMYRIWIDHGRDLKAVRKNYPHLAAEQINMGEAYAREYLNEMPPPAPPPAFAQSFKP